MRITILGAGAMGCLFGALLAKAGSAAEVRLLDRSAEVVAAIRRDGVRLLEGAEEQAQAIPATTRPEEAGDADVALVLVKSGGTRWAAEMAERALAPGGLALTLQNGLGNRETLAEVLGEGRAWQGVTAQGATLLGPGLVRHAGSGPTHLETRPEIAQRAAEMAALFEAAGLETHVAGDLGSLLWGKLVVNVGINALTALLRVPNGALAEIPEARAAMAAAVAEAVCVARARGVALPYAEPLDRVLEVCRATASNRSSMLQDVLRGLPTEIQAINGAIVRAARELGLAAPANEMLVNLVEAIGASEEARVTTLQGEIR